MRSFAILIAEDCYHVFPTVAHLMQEDLCLMKEDNQGVLRFVSGAVLFPQRWSLLEKLGMDMNRIHSPVPLYEEEIGRPVATFMQRLTVERPFWRCNWTVNPFPLLSLPLSLHDTAFASKTGAECK